MLSNKELAEVFESLAIPAYRKCIDDIRGKGLREAIEICSRMDLQHGVCYFIAHNNMEIDSYTLIRDYYRPKSVYWCETPFSATSTAEIISLHERRIEIMQEIIDYVKNEKE